MNSSYLKNNHCICGVLIADTSKQCNKCHLQKVNANQLGKHNPNYKDGRTEIKRNKFTNVKRIRTILTKSFLEQEYIINKKSVNIISKEQNMDKKTIFRYLKKYNIKTRSSSEAKKGYKYSLEHREKQSKAMKEAYSKHGIECECLMCSAKRGKYVANNNPNWQGGIGKLPYAFEFTVELKEKIRKRDNYQCQNCGMTEEEHLIVVGKELHVHHIDYVKLNCQENNLIAVCGSCNIRANYNRDYWKQFYQNKIEAISHAS